MEVFRDLNFQVPYRATISEKKVAYFKQTNLQRLALLNSDY